MPRKKWYRRWDVIGLIGLLIGGSGIALSIYQDVQGKKLAERQAKLSECRAKESELEALQTDKAVRDERVEGLLVALDSFLDKEKATVEHYERAKKYIDALSAELSIGKTVSSVSDAISNFKNRFGEDAFNVESANTWVANLTEAGYPSALTDRQLLARNMMDWGLESGAANFMVLTPRDEESTRRLIDALRDLSVQMAVRRDENCLEGIQGIQDTTAYLASLERNVQEIKDNVRDTRSTVEEARNDARSTAASLNRAEMQFEALDC